jgi:hypothetical protein
MPLTTPVVAVKTTPTVLATAFSHFTSKLHPSGHKKRDKDAFSGEGEMEDPQDYFSYSEGLNVVWVLLSLQSIPALRGRRRKGGESASSHVKVDLGWYERSYVV